MYTLRGLCYCAFEYDYKRPSQDPYSQTDKWVLNMGLGHPRGCLSKPGLALFVWGALAQHREIGFNKEFLGCSATYRRFGVRSANILGVSWLLPIGDGCETVCPTHRWLATLGWMISDVLLVSVFFPTHPAAFFEGGCLCTETYKQQMLCRYVS